MMNEKARTTLLTKELEELLVKLYEKKQRESTDIAELLQDVRSNRIDDLSMRASRILSEAEKNYLAEKDLAIFTKVNRKTNPYDKSTMTKNAYAHYGTSNWFMSTLKKEEDIYKFTIPPLCSKRNMDRHAGDGRYISYLVSNLLESYEKEHFTFIEKINKPVLVFVHHISNKNNIMKLMDADNVDIKTATDALYGFLIDDDNLLTLYPLHIGVKDNESFCDMYVMEREKFPGWVEKNKGLFV